MKTLYILLILTFFQFVPTGLYSQSAEELINNGKEKSSKGDFKGAITDLDKAIELNPNSSEAYFERGFVKKKLIDYDNAVLDFNKAIELDSNNYDAYFQRGNVKPT